MSQPRIRELLDKLLNNNCSPAEKQELFQLAEQVEDHPGLSALLEDAWNRHDKPVHTLSDTHSATLLEQILNDGKVVPMTRRRKLLSWPRIAAAAAVLLLAGLGIYWLMRQQPTAPQPAEMAFKNDVKAPAGNKATITLAGGRQVLLQDVQQGQLTTQGNTQVVVDKNGQIVYEATDKNNRPETIFNTLNNPRGSQVTTLVLSDGTRVWLNAGSSLTYPVAFANNERKVTVSGEAYFEVMPQHPKGGHKIPFIVKMVSPSGDRGEIKVLGTHFNIKAYDDEDDTKVTLLEGSVEVHGPVVKGTHEVAMLVPGRQISILPQGSLSTHIVDVEQTVAWKNGLFDYKSSNITQVLRDAARWYDIDIAYEAEKPGDTFTGGISRSASLTELLTILQMSRVRFKLEGRKLTVLK